MGTTVRTTLENALYLSIADREYSPVEPTGSKINVALDIFIDLLDIYKDQVPFLSTKTLNSVEELENINAAYINALDYVLGDVLYPMMQMNQQEYSRVATLLNFKSLPYWFWHNKQENKIEIFPPGQAGTNKFIMGYQPLLSVTSLDEPIPSTIPNFMRVFLEYETARLICERYNVTWSTLKEETRQRYEEKMLENSQWTPGRPARECIAQTRRYPFPWLYYLTTQGT